MRAARAAVLALVLPLSDLASLVNFGRAPAAAQHWGLGLGLLIPYPNLLSLACGRDPIGGGRGLGSM
jgi:hypothetical protein